MDTPPADPPIAPKLERPDLRNASGFLKWLVKLVEESGHVFAQVGVLCGFGEIMLRCSKGMCTELAAFAPKAVK